MQDLETRLLELKRQGQQDSVDLTRLQKGVQMRNNQVLFHKTLARTHTHLHRCVCCSLCCAWQDCMFSVRACARYILSARETLASTSKDTPLKHTHKHHLQLACNTTAACHSGILRKGGNCSQGQCHFFLFLVCMHAYMPSYDSPPQITTVCLLHYLLICRS